MPSPTLKMPATTPFLAAAGRWSPGAVWPFVCIVIMCGALSGFHALIASGTTPKMINKESDIRPIGYGAMILEGFVALTALVAACALEPGDYFAINVAAGHAADERPSTTQIVARRAKTEHELGPGRPRSLPDAGEGRCDENLVGRTGGAVTLAVGMAKVFSSLPRHEAPDGLLVPLRHHVRGPVHPHAAGDRHARGPVRVPGDAGPVQPEYTIGHKPKWGMNVVMSVLVCGLWGGLLYIGNLDTLWRMLGIANQLLATIALAVGTTYLLKHTPKRIYALCTGIPLVFVVVTVFTAGVQSIQMWWDAAGDDDRLGGIPDAAGLRAGRHHARADGDHRRRRRAQLDGILVNGAQRVARTRPGRGQSLRTSKPDAPLCFPSVSLLFQRKLNGSSKRKRKEEGGWSLSSAGGSLRRPQHLRHRGLHLLQPGAGHAPAGPASSSRG